MAQFMKNVSMAGAGLIIARRLRVRAVHDHRRRLQASRTHAVIGPARNARTPAGSARWVMRASSGSIRCHNSSNRSGAVAATSPRSPSRRSIVTNPARSAGATRQAAMLSGQAMVSGARDVVRRVAHRVDLEQLVDRIDGDHRIDRRVVGAACGLDVPAVDDGLERLVPRVEAEPAAVAQREVRARFVRVDAVELSDEPVGDSVPLVAERGAAGLDRDQARAAAARAWRACRAPRGSRRRGGRRRRARSSRGGAGPARRDRASEPTRSPARTRRAARPDDRSSPRRTYEPARRRRGRAPHPSRHGCTGCTDGVRPISSAVAPA